jgi:hypothetical protein
MRLSIPLIILLSMACDMESKDSVSDTQAPDATDEATPDDDDSSPVDSADPDSPADVGPSDTAGSTDSADSADSATGSSDTAGTDTAEDTGSEDTGSEPAPPTDLDGDGWAADEGDCDDYDSSIHPDREEICDGIDNDCDGDIDEEAIPTWYLDFDGDGHGTDAFTYDGCEPMEGYVLLSDDCDDTSGMVYPDADEWCDEVDNNCNGVIDEDVTETFFLDEDEDGFGDAGFTIEACTVPDGYVHNADDCNDLEGGTHPDADETCDGADNDCDGETDEDESSDATTYYRDADTDGFGDVTSTTSACALPDGYTLNTEDCDDHDDDIHPDALEHCDDEDNDCDGDIDESDAADALTFFLDSDDDGFGDPAEPASACAVEDGYTLNNEDCNDHDPLIHPDAPEVCDSADNDCDGETDEDDATDALTYYRDSDADGFGDVTATANACTVPDGYTENSTDCDDHDDDIHPDALERCDDEDNDCDGDTDEDDAVDALTFFRDSDTDGFGDPDAFTSACAAPDGYTDNDQDCQDEDPLIHPDAPEICDSADNDCDGATDEDDATGAATFYRDSDTDGYGDAAETRQACALPVGYSDNSDDCDDLDGAIYPGATERCDGDDNDCDGTTDEDDAVDALTFFRDSDTDGFGDRDAITSACAAPDGYTDNDQDCQDEDPLIHPDAVELCDSIDNDCDGVTDEDDAVDAVTYYFDADVDGFGDHGVPITQCGMPSGYVEDSTDCDDTSDAVHPGADEYCNDADDDCDGETDEGVPVDSLVYYIDLDSDGYGDTYTSFIGCDPGASGVETPGDCNDEDASISPAAVEVCDSIDNDCDGEADESSAADATTYHPDADGDGYGSSSESIDSCVMPSGYIIDDSDCNDSASSVYPGASEVIGDGIDQDCDGSDIPYPPHTGSEPGWYHGNYGEGPEFDSGRHYNGTVACSTVCAGFGLTHQGARFVCNLSGSGPTEGCDSSNDGQYGDANCGMMVRDWVLASENGNLEDCAGGNIMGCLTGSCFEAVSYHSIECQCS